MPWYEFERRGALARVLSDYDHAPKMLTAMYSIGWRQVYSPGKPIIHLSYQEALEETDELLALADRGEGPLVGK